MLNQRVVDSIPSVYAILLVLKQHFTRHQHAPQSSLASHVMTTARALPQGRVAIREAPLRHRTLGQGDENLLTSHRVRFELTPIL